MSDLPPLIPLPAPSLRGKRPILKKVMFSSSVSSSVSSSASSSASSSVAAACSYCFASIRIDALSACLSCSVCRAINVAVLTVVASASCGCGGIAVRYAGQDALTCQKCRRITYEAQCGQCRQRFVFPKEWPSDMLPCVHGCAKPTPMVRARLPVERVVRRLLVQARSSVRALASAGCGIVATGEAELCVQPYLDASASRMAEMDHCLARNLDNPELRRVTLLAESDRDAVRFGQVFAGACAAGRLVVKNVGRRIFMSDALARLESDDTIVPGTLCVIANADVYFDDTLSAVKRDPMRNVVMAQSRLDVVNEKRVVYDLFSAAMSQDAWLFRKGRVAVLREISESGEAKARAHLAAAGSGAERVQRKVPTAATVARAGVGRHFFGWPGADNRIAHDLATRGVTLRNQPTRVRVWHVHASDVRRAGDARVLPPYAPVPPTGTATAEF